MKTYFRFFVILFILLINGFKIFAQQDTSEWQVNPTVSLLPFDY